MGVFANLAQVGYSRQEIVQRATILVDYVIVGAGSAGCVLASRLTENPNTTVRLLEAGAPDDKPELRVPTYWFNLLNTDVDWRYRTESQSELNNRVIEWSRGKVLGGSSSINAMLFVRGHRWDFDHWAALGNAGWGYDEVLPYFKKMEHFAGGSPEYRGMGGALNIIVSNQPYTQPVSEVFIAAGRDMGLRFTDDFNGVQQAGVGWYQANIKGGERHSVVDAYLRPALKRENLKAITGAHAMRILLEGKRAVGVEYVQAGETKQAFADVEVIVCGGAVNSPQLLMCSGIGPAAHLAEVGVPVVVDLPGVGANLQDHPKIDLHFTSTPRTRDDFSLGSAAYDEYQQSRTGKLSVIRSQVGAFVRIHPEAKIPDVQFYAAQASTDDDFDFVIVASLLRPKDRGTIRLRSADPFEHPVIQPNYLSSREDLRVFVDSVKWARAVVQTQAFSGFYEAEVNPGAAIQTDEQIEAWVRDSLETTWHCTSTCKMGTDEMAVVDPQLCVHGVGGLRVVDASVMPTVVGGNTNAATIMIAEKAADMMKEGV